MTDFPNIKFYGNSLDFQLTLGCFKDPWNIPKRDPKLIGLIYKERFATFSENPGKFRDKFVRLVLMFCLTWQDIMVILAYSCTLDEKDCILRNARELANGLLAINLH